MTRTWYLCRPTPVTLSSRRHVACLLLPPARPPRRLLCASWVSINIQYLLVEANIRFASAECTCVPVRTCGGGGGSQCVPLPVLLRVSVPDARRLDCIEQPALEQCTLLARAERSPTERVPPRRMTSSIASARIDRHSREPVAITSRRDCSSEAVQFTSALSATLDVRLSATEARLVFASNAFPRPACVPPVPSRPVPSRPVPSRPVPSRPVPSRPVPSRPVSSS